MAPGLIAMYAMGRLTTLRGGGQSEISLVTGASFVKGIFRVSSDIATFDGSGPKSKAMGQAK